MLQVLAFTCMTMVVFVKLALNVLIYQINRSKKNIVNLNGIMTIEYESHIKLGSGGFGLCSFIPVSEKKKDTYINIR